MIGLTPVAMSTTSLTPISPRVASTTSGGRPKTIQIIHQRLFEAIGYLLELTSLSNLVYTGVFVVQSSDESERIASGVDLVVNGTLGEDRPLTRAQSIDDESSTVLFDETRFQRRPIRDEQELCRSRVGVRAVHTAWSEIRGFFFSEWVRGGYVSSLTPFEPQPWRCHWRIKRGSSRRSRR